MGMGGGMVRTMPQPPYPWEKDLVPILQEAGWAPEPGWTVWKILPPLAFNPQTDHLAHSEFL